MPPDDATQPADISLLYRSFRFPILSLSLSLTHTHTHKHTHTHTHTLSLSHCRITHASTQCVWPMHHQDGSPLSMGEQLCRNWQPQVLLTVCHVHVHELHIQHDASSHALCLVHAKHQGTPRQPWRWASLASLIVHALPRPTNAPHQHPRTGSRVGPVRIVHILYDV